MAEISNAKLRANRDNAQKSTGPRSELGKLKSAANSSKHGLHAKDSNCWTTAERVALEKLFRNICRSMGAEGRLERLVCRDIADCQWRLVKAQQQLDVEMQRSQSVSAALLEAISQESRVLRPLRKYLAVIEDAVPWECASWHLRRTLERGTHEGQAKKEGRREVTTYLHTLRKQFSPQTGARAFDSGQKQQATVASGNNGHNRHEEMEFDVQMDNRAQLYFRYTTSFRRALYSAVEHLIRLQQLRKGASGDA